MNLRGSGVQRKGWNGERERRNDLQYLHMEFSEKVTNRKKQTKKPHQIMGVCVSSGTFI